MAKICSFQGVIVYENDIDKNAAKCLQKFLSIDNINFVLIKDIPNCLGFIQKNGCPIAIITYNIKQGLLEFLEIIRSIFNCSSYSVHIPVINIFAKPPDIDLLSQLFHFDVSEIVVLSPDVNYTFTSIKFFTKRAIDKFIALSGLLENNLYLQFGSIVTLCKALDTKDSDTASHVERVGRHVFNISINLGFSEDEAFTLGYASMVHDIGKMNMPNAILRSTKSLTPEELEVIRQHPKIGYNLLINIFQKATDKLLLYAKQTALYHHEKLDGSGYPFGVSADNIPFQAQLTTVADIYDALTHSRPYRLKTYTPEEAFTILEADVLQGKLDKDMVHALKDSVYNPPKHSFNFYLPSFEPIN